MIIPAEIYANFPSAYKKVIDELESKIADCKSEEYTVEPILNFAKNYLTPWQYLKHCENVQMNQFQQIMSMEIFGSHDYSFELESLDTEMAAFHFYHNDLDVWSAEMGDIYVRIQEATENVEEWFKLICETNDDIFIRHNSMYRLSKDLTDKKLWNLYINYLQQKDPLEMLQIYSKYCRFFLDDFKMKENYKNEAKKFGSPVIVPWENDFEFEEMGKNDNFGFKRKEPKKAEIFDENKLRNYYDEIYKDYGVPSAENNVELETFETSKPPELKYQCKISDNFINQEFPFHNSVMSYILKNGNSTVLKLLQQTCKYYFVKIPICFCHKLIINDDETHFEEDSLFLNEKIENTDFFKQLYITAALEITSCYTMPDTYISTSIIPKLYKCDVKYIEIQHQTLSFDAFKFLIGHGNVITLDFQNVQITNSDDEIVALEEVTQFLPNVEDLSYGPVNVNRNTSTALMNQNFCSKISSFVLVNIFGEPFDYKEFLEFCNKIRDKNFFWLGLQFSSEDFPEENMQQLFTLLKQYENDTKYFGFNLNGQTHDVQLR
uniref:Uncharacterized protein n=1 Tax=Panagrolaimus sp. ES5 TaxID=591445 RepID=A0AC34GY76_9BILA